MCANKQDRNGAIGADLHIRKYAIFLMTSYVVAKHLLPAFPIAIRASYGYWLSCFCVISRGILALFWFGVQSAGGATAITQMITAIFPSYDHLHNSLPASAGITSKGLLSYFIYHVVQTSFLFIRTEKLRWTGIMLTDYWFVKKSKIDVPALYDPEGIYGKCVSILCLSLRRIANYIRIGALSSSWYWLLYRCFQHSRTKWPQITCMFPKNCRTSLQSTGKSLQTSSANGTSTCAEMSTGSTALLRLVFSIMLSMLHFRNAGPLYLPSPMVIRYMKALRLVSRA